MMPRMRTTLTLNPDVEKLLQRKMRRTHNSMKAVVNDALRSGLGIRCKTSKAPRYRVEPHAFGFRSGIDPFRLNQLADELEAEEFVRRREP